MTSYFISCWRNLIPVNQIANLANEVALKLLAALGISFLLSLSGCSTLVRQQKSTMTYSDGCYLRIETFSNTKAKAVDKDWDIENKCNVDLDIGIVEENQPDDKVEDD
jgi:uncharacterized protein YceK